MSCARGDGYDCRAMGALMPLASSSLAGQSFARLIVLGAPKVGKTTTCAKTSPGGVYVINSDDEFALRPAATAGAEFTYDTALGSEHDLGAIERAIREAQKGVKEGRYRTIIWDTVTRYAARAEDVFAAASAGGSGKPDPRRWYPAHRKHVMNSVDRLLALPAHVILICHYQDKYRDQEGQAQPVREGIVPALGGKLAADLPAMVSDVVYLDRERSGERVFICSSQGVYGPGGRNLTGVDKVPADVSKLLDVMAQKKGDPR